MRIIVRYRLSLCVSFVVLLQPFNLTHCLLDKICDSVMNQSTPMSPRLLGHDVPMHPTMLSSLQLGSTFACLYVYSSLIALFF